MEQRVSVRKQTVHRPSVYVLRATMDTTVRTVGSSEIALLFPGALYFLYSYLCLPVFLKLNNPVQIASLYRQGIS